MRAISFLIACAAAVGSLTSAAAQDYPTRPIVVLVPFAAGGNVDTVTRIITEHMARTLGQPFVMENISGAGGTTGSIRGARAAPDGYTVTAGNMGTHSAAVGFYPKLAYDPRSDFEPIGLMAGTPILILAKRDFPARDLREFVAYAKANADKLNQGHAGVGSVSFTTCLLLDHLLGIKPVRIPYGGSGPTMNALVAGHVDFVCDQVLNAVPQVSAGNIKAYAVATPERNPALPDVPTTQEAGLPEYQVSAWNALFAPKGTPKAIVDKLADALSKALDDSGVRKRLLDLGSDLPEGEKRGPAALSAHVKAEVDRWAPLIKAAGAEAR
jgi:tripartite-type tricarboxylate transporter receptor subunit TctC